jgi:phospholipid/cholesterol/gamma-HCH transport system substrate-binding protein
MNLRAVRLFAVIAVAVGLLVLFLIGKPFGHKLVVKAYFTNAMALRSGAAVRMAGVDIGSVQAVRARPEMKEAPAEVVMVLTTSYDLQVPNDSTASVSTVGVLGQAYVAIDASHASGPPIATNGVLHTNPTTELSTPEMLRRFGEIMSKRCDCASSNDHGSGKKISQYSPQ